MKMRTLSELFLSRTSNGTSSASGESGNIPKLTKSILVWQQENGGGVRMFCEAYKSKSVGVFQKC